MAEDGPDLISSYTTTDAVDAEAMESAGILGIHGESTDAPADPSSEPDPVRPSSSQSQPHSLHGDDQARIISERVSSRPASASPGASPQLPVPAQAETSPGNPAGVGSLSLSGSRPPSSTTRTNLPTASPSAAARPPSGSAAARAAATSPATALPPSSSPTPSRPATGVSPSALPSRPVSREAPGVQAAAVHQQALRNKVAAAEAAGYVAPGLRMIDVQVAQGPGLPHRMLRVLMDYTQQEAKPYLGGFRNKRSAVVYHHAATQTPKAPRFAGAEPKLERQTQTVKVVTRGQQSVREAGTQMERPGVVIDTSYDRILTPGRYQTSEERLEIVVRATRTIQRWWRGVRGRKRADYLRRKKAEREAFLREEESKALQAAEEHRRKEIERRMHPRTAADFEILYNELEAWRLQETRKIKDAHLGGDQEQAVLAQLLHKETKLLQTIDRLKINANLENKELRIQHTLGKMSQPKKYELKNGQKVEVHTPFTTRAKELMQLYNGLNLPLLTVDERLDVLLHVKWTAKEFDCNLTRELVELIDREADLLNRGRSPKMLEGLRKRISSLFLTFVETPEFNPEAAAHQVVPMDFEQYLFDKLDRSAPRTTLVPATTSKWDY
ncbi:hypothetical protein QJQ45_018218 [Haematococcus lacustris]|nr:hypothetical protein QJQ45_018218 [Haematococcus lacustris]